MSTFDKATVFFAVSYVLYLIGRTIYFVIIGRVPFNFSAIIFDRKKSLAAFWEVIIARIFVIDLLTKYIFNNFFNYDNVLFTQILGFGLIAAIILALMAIGDYEPSNENELNSLKRNPVLDLSIGSMLTIGAFFFGVYMTQVKSISSSWLIGLVVLPFLLALGAYIYAFQALCQLMKNILPKKSIWNLITGLIFTSSSFLLGAYLFQQLFNNGTSQKIMAENSLEYGYLPVILFIIFFTWFIYTINTFGQLIKNRRKNT